MFRSDCTDAHADMDLHCLQPAQGPILCVTFHMGSAMQKHVFGHMGKSNAAAQSDQGLHCLLTESLDTTECMNGEQR